MGLKFYWSPIDAVIAAIVGAMGILILYLAFPGLHPLAYGAGGLFVAAMIYQTGSELSARRKSLKHRGKLG